MKYKGRLKGSVIEMKMHGKAVKGELLPFIVGGTFVQHAQSLGAYNYCISFDN